RPPRWRTRSCRSCAPESDVCRAAYVPAGEQVRLRQTCQMTWCAVRATTNHRPRHASSSQASAPPRYHTACSAAFHPALALPLAGGSDALDGAPDRPAPLVLDTAAGMGGPGLEPGTSCL